MGDILRAGGIYKLGYGTISKLVMLDHRLNMGAKGVYVYLCSFAGAGDVAFPFRNKITSDLNISVHTYYGYMNQLTEYGYITKEQQRKGTRFSHNIYTINQFIARNDCIDILKENGIDTSSIPPMPLIDIDIIGYGKIPKAVTTDATITIKSKAIFGFIASNNHWMNPDLCSWSNLCKIMHISKTTFYKTIDELLASGYIMEQRQEMVKGYDKPVYHINVAYTPDQQEQI